MPVIDCGNVKVKGSKEALQALFASLQPPSKLEGKVPVLVYLETCNSSYFNGFSGHVYALSVSDKARNGEVKNALIHAINTEELWLEGESAPLDFYDRLGDQAIRMFKGLHTLKRWSQREMGEDCYVYFGVALGDK